MPARDGLDVAEDAFARASTRVDRQTRHETLLRAYDVFCGADARKNRGRALRDAPYEDTDALALAREHRFVRDDDEDEERSREWGAVGEEVHTALFKTYCVCDLSRADDGGVTDARAWGCGGAPRMRCDGGRAADVWGETVRAGEGLATFECHSKYSEGRTEEPAAGGACESCAKKLGVSDGFERVDEEAAEEERRARRERKSRRSEGESSGKTSGRGDERCATTS